jgi:hypothetical protein
MSLRKGASVLAAVALMTVPGRSSSQDSNPLLLDKVSRATAADLAMLVAESGYSAGFILTLPQEKEEVLARLAASHGQMMERSGFGVWFKSESGATDWATQRLRSTVELDETLTRFAARETGRWLAGTSPEPSVRTLKDTGATACEQRMTRTVTQAVESRDLNKAISTLLRETTGASVPRGFIGTCIGTNQFVEEPVRITPGRTLKDALNSVVGGFGSSIWVAIESRSGLCSLGVIHRGMNGGVCTTAITDNIPQK